MEDEDDENDENDETTATTTTTKRRRVDLCVERIRRATIDISVSKMKLNSFCSSQLLIQEIERCTLGVTQVAIEASRLINLHILCLIASKKPIPKLDQTYFYRAFTLASGSAKSAALNAFGDALDIYKAIRPSYMGYLIINTCPNY